MPFEKSTVLLTLGRLPVALELARAFHQAGWRVIVAEPFGWHLCRLSVSVARSHKVTAPSVDSPAYLRELEAIIAAESVSLVVPVSEEILFVSALRERLGEATRLLCMAQASLLQLHDKWQFFRLAEQHRLAVPQTALGSDADGCRQIARQPYVVKPRFSCSGAGVSFSAADTAVSEAHANDRYIVQQRLPGAACCSFSIAADGAVLTNICYRSLLEAGSVSVCFEQIALPDAVAAFIADIVRLTRYSGMIAFDFIQDSEGHWHAIECNPRATSGLHFLPPADLLQALIDQQAVAPQTLRGRRQEFWSCLMQVEGALLRGRIDRQGWRHLFTTRDINWRWSDIKPFALASFVMVPYLYQSVRLGKPLSQILLSDVGWHDDDAK